MVKAITRAFRWRKMLESGEFATIREIADAEKINESYVGRLLRMTLLAPDIVKGILGGRQPVALNMDKLMKWLPMGWRQQRTDMFAQAAAAIATMDKGLQDAKRSESES